MEILSLVFVVLFIYFGSRWFKKLFGKAVGLNKSVSILMADEIPSNIILICSDSIKFSGFSGIESASEGRLFTTSKRLLFTNPKGNKIGLSIDLNKIRKFSVISTGIVRAARMLIEYEGENGAPISHKFHLTQNQSRQFSTSVLEPFVSSNVDDKKVLQNWIDQVMIQFPILKTGSSEGGVKS